MPDPIIFPHQQLIEVYTEGDYNEYLTSMFSTMRIINSTRACWPIVELYFNIDNQIIIEKNIYGVHDIKVKIYYTLEDAEERGEPMIWNLLYMQANVDLPTKRFDNKTHDNSEEFQRRIYKVTCLSKPSFIAMSKNVNLLLEGDDTGYTPLDVIIELLDNNGIKYLILDGGANEETIPQLLIPPMSIKSATDYINEKFGIFKGPMFRYAGHNGEYYLWDLKEKWEKLKDIGFTKHHKVPNYIEDPGLFEEINVEAAMEPEVYLTYDMVETLHYANSTMIKYKYDNTYIAHPHTEIAHYHNFNSDEIIEELGLWHDNPEMKYHKDLVHLKNYFYDQKGFEVADGYTGIYDDHFGYTELANNFKDASSVKFTLLRNVRVNYCQRVGEIFYFKPHALHEKFPGSNYEGGYLVTDSEIILSKESRGPWEDNIACTCTIIGCRTVQSKD